MHIFAYLCIFCASSGNPTPWITFGVLGYLCISWGYSWDNLSEKDIVRISHGYPKRQYLDLGYPVSELFVRRPIFVLGISQLKSRYPWPLGFFFILRNYHNDAMNILSCQPGFIAWRESSLHWAASKTIFLYIFCTFLMHISAYLLFAYFAI